MARKRNVDAYGKSWSPVDIPNLEKAVELYKRLNELNDHFANSLSGSNKIWAQINERTELQEALNKTGIKITQRQSEEVLKLLKNQQSLNKEVNKTNHSQSYINYATNRQSNINLNNIGSSYFQNKMETEAAKYLGNAARAAGRKYTKGTAEYNNYIDAYMTTGRGGKELAKSANKFSLAADVIQVGANTFKEAVSTFSRLFFGGMNNQANSYNNNFTNISVRTGLSKSQYFSGQSAINSTLSSRGLYNNISNSEVTEMWNKLASNGLNSEDMMANALDTVITNKIVPFLDTSTAYFQQLTDQQPGLMKQIRGIGLATQEINGSSVFANKYLQDMVDSLSPMASLAENQLGVQYAQMTGAYESLRAQGLSDATIGEMYKGSAALYNDPLAALKSNNLDLKLAAAQGIANGIDFRDASQVNAQYMRSANYVANLTPEGYMSPLYAGITSTYMSTIGKTELNERNLNIEEALRKGTLVASGLDKYANIATDRLASDYNQTAKTLQEVQLENMSTWLAKIYEQIGYWGNVLGVLVKGIAGIIGARVGSKLLGSLIKGKSGGVGLAQGLANFGAGGITNIGAKGSSAASVSAGTVATGLAGVAGIAAGGAMAVKGGMDVYNDFATGNVNGKTALSATGAAGGAIGAGALIALGASNPVGWVALAVGGLALAGRAAINYAEYVEKSTDASEELQKELDSEVRQKEENTKREMVALENYQERIKQSSDFETAKKLAIEAGITTEKELKDAQIDTKDALIDLTETYIAEKKKLNQDTTQYLKDIKGINNEQQKQFIDEFLTKYGVDMDYKNLGEKDYNALNAYGFQMQEYANQLIQQGKISSDGKTYENDTYKHIAYMVEKGLLSHDYTDSNFTEEDYRILFRTGNNADRRIAGKNMLLNGEYYNNVVANSYVRDVLGNKYQYNAMLGNENAIASVLGELVLAAGKGDKAAVENYITQLKNLGVYSKDNLTGQAKTDLEAAMEKVGISSYRIGLNKVPYDNYLANLHEGEAVLTASTANELRGLITEYRESQNQGAIIEVAISNQTTILVEKMSEIIQTIQSVNTSSTNTSSWSSTVRTSMKNMISTKSF